MATQSSALAQSSTTTQISSTKANRIGLLSIVFAHTSVDMQTSSLTVLLPLLLATFSLDYAATTFIIGLNNLIIAMTQPLFGLLGDRKPMRWLLFAGCLLCGGAMVTVTQLPSYILVLVAVVISGLGSAMYHPEALAAVRDVSGKRQVSGTSFFFFGGNLGSALGPFLATALIAALGKNGAPGMIVPTLLAFGMLLTQRELFRVARPKLDSTP